jgi:diadenylate cyclase
MPELLDMLDRAWRPAIEILILAVGLYYVFTFVRGRRGAAIVTGFLVVVLTLALVTNFLQLTVLGRLLGSIAAFAVIGVLVIFQPEIRQMLAKVGNLQVFGSAHEQREAIEVIIRAAERLTEAHIGGLIAIEQSVPLREEVENKVPVHCEATPEMLETIFFPNNAMHDGGVIIKGDRIAYAGCIFPLTPRQDLDKSMGTRHRAAIGLSEETDAIVVCVSEEKGLISYAYKGELVRGVSPEDLRAFLSSVLVMPDRPRNVREWLLAHVPSSKPQPAPPAESGKQPGAAAVKTQTPS